MPASDSTATKAVKTAKLRECRVAAWIAAETTLRAAMAAHDTSYIVVGAIIDLHGPDQPTPLISAVLVTEKVNALVEATREVERAAWLAADRPTAAEAAAVLDAACSKNSGA